MANLNVEDDKLIDDMAEWVNNFIATRFTGTLSPEWRTTIADMLVEAFSAGAEWAEQNISLGEEIIAAKHAPKIEVVR